MGVVLGPEEDVAAAAAALVAGMSSVDIGASASRGGPLWVRGSVRFNSVFGLAACC